MLSLLITRIAKGLKYKCDGNFHYVLTNKIDHQNLYKIKSLFDLMQNHVYKANGGFFEGMQREDTNS